MLNKRDSLDWLDMSITTDVSGDEDGWIYVEKK